METGQFAAGFAARHAQAPKAKPRPQALARDRGANRDFQFPK
jgi:hypothetical protein